jgi:hypothetical protein
MAEAASYAVFESHSRRPSKAPALTRRLLSEYAKARGYWDDARPDNNNRLLISRDLSTLNFAQYLRAQHAQHVPIGMLRCCPCRTPGKHTSSGQARGWPNKDSFLLFPRIARSQLWNGLTNAQAHATCALDLAACQHPFELHHLVSTRCPAGRDWGNSGR